MKLGLSTESWSEKGKLRSADGADATWERAVQRETEGESKGKRDREKVSASSQDLASLSLLAHKPRRQINPVSLHLWSLPTQCQEPLQ